MDKLFRLCSLILPVLVVILVDTQNVPAAVIFSENFEYSQNTQNCTQTMALNGWKWDDCKDDSTQADSNGYVGISNIHAHSGTRASLHHFMPQLSSDGHSTDAYFEKYASYGDDLWIEMWLYLARETGMMSTFHNPSLGLDSKWVYTYLTGQSGQTGAFACLMLPGDINWIYPPNYSSNGQFPNYYTGSWQEIHSVCSDKTFGENLYSGSTLLNNRYFIPVNTWTRSIVHLNTHYVNSSTPNVEVWVDNGGGLVKTNQYAYQWTNGLDGTIGRIKFGTTWTSEAWIFTDDIKIATSRNDIDWSSSSNPPPSPPQNLTVQ